MSKRTQTPLEYMLAIMNDPDADPERRDKMAINAAPYCHARITPPRHAKKQAQTNAAMVAGLGTPWAKDLDFEIRPS